MTGVVSLPPAVVGLRASCCARTCTRCGVPSGASIVCCCCARAQGAHRSAFCTHEELATAVRRMPMYTACGCRFIARGCRKQCAVMSARSALLDKWNGLSESRKSAFLPLLLLLRMCCLKQSCSSSRDLSNGPLTSIHFGQVRSEYRSVSPNPLM